MKLSTAYYIPIWLGLIGAVMTRDSNLLIIASIFYVIRAIYDVNGR